MEDAWPDHALMDPEVLGPCSAGWVCAYDEARVGRQLDARQAVEGTA